MTTTTKYFDPSEIFAIQSMWSAVRDIDTKAIETSEATDEEISKSLEDAGFVSMTSQFYESDGCPDTISAEDEEFKQAIYAGMDAWWDRPEVRFELLTTYNSAPLASNFKPASLVDLQKIDNDLDSCEHTATTDWSRSAWELDKQLCARSMEVVTIGKQVFVAQDEDGYYFATGREQ